MATFALAEYYLRLNKSLKNKEAQKAHTCLLFGLKDNCEQIESFLATKANTFFQRADFHAGDNGHMDEQMNRDNGYMQGARDLTWSYAAHLSALLEK